MTRVDVSLEEFGIDWDDGSTPVLLVSSWGIFESHPGDIVARPDERGAFTVHLPPTLHKSAFYSVQLTWELAKRPKSRFYRIKVPESGPTQLLDLVVEPGQQ